MIGNNLEESSINSIDNNFGKFPEFYRENAIVQKEVADRLIASLDPWKETLPAGPILELGCGTGFVTEGLLNLFRGRDLLINDSSVEMLDACKDRITKPEGVQFQNFDAQQIPVNEPTYALTISSFLAQWFRQPAYTLGQWLEVTKPGGLLLAAFPGNESFPAWKTHCETLGIPFTGNDLPDTEEMVVKLSSDITQVDYYEDTVTQSFDSASDFFRHMKKIGAGQQLKGRHLTPKEMRMLIEYWDNEADGDVTVRYHVVFLAVKKNA